MQHAYIVDRLMKITNFHEKIDEFNEKPMLKLGNQPKVEYSTKLTPFETVKVQKMNHITSLHEVATKVSIGETVNIDLKEVEPIEINTQYGIKKNFIIVNSSFNVTYMF